MANAEEACGTTSSYDGGGGSGGAKAPRLPRWTRQEILVLVQGKKMAEGRGRRGGRGAGEALVVAGGGPLEPKWASVSTYCRRHGVDRGPVPCRKRWSNLASDFKKIKEWEVKGRESFWTMRNDTRREKKLPGFFDREVFDILDGVTTRVVLAAKEEEEEEEGDGKGSKERSKAGSAAAAAPRTEAEEVVFDSGRTAAEDGLFSEFEEEKEVDEEEEEEEAPPTPATPVVAVPISEKKYEAYRPGNSGQATPNENQPASNPEKAPMEQEGHKRRRTLQEGAADVNLQDHLIEVLDRNSRMLTSLIEAHNKNCQLDRDQRNDHTTSLLGVLDKFADALGRIADKL